MSEENAQVSSEQSEAPTLDQVISDFNVPVKEEVSKANEFTPTQPQRLDAYDEEGLNRFASEVQKNQAALQTEIQRLTESAAETTKLAAEAATDVQIKSAVKVITKGIEGLDPLAAEFILEKAARDNDKFAQLFRDQDKNPDLYKSALEAIITENDGKFQRVDTQIAENHRAAQQSTQSNNTQSQSKYDSPLEEALGNAKTEGERQLIWANIRDGGL